MEEICVWGQLLFLGELIRKRKLEQLTMFIVGYWSMVTNSPERSSLSFINRKVRNLHKNAPVKICFPSGANHTVNNRNKLF